jgi:hypothetical protein
MSRPQRNKKHKRNWKEPNENSREKKIKFSKVTTRQKDFEEYLDEYGGLNDETKHL